jgi:hypothetical protein
MESELGIDSLRAIDGMIPFITADWELLKPRSGFACRWWSIAGRLVTRTNSRPKRREGNTFGDRLIPISRRSNAGGSYSFEPSGI